MTDVREAPSKTRTVVSPLERLAGTDDAALHQTLDKIQEFGLTENLLELQVQGYTVVRGVLSPDKIARAKAAILRRVESKTDRKIDPETATADDFHGMAYQHYLLFDDPVFQEILLEPKPLAMMTYLLGESCVLSSMGCHFRGPGGLPLAVHSDTPGPVPYSPTSIVANVNYALTPYSREAGALVMFPGSHLKQRQPTPHENWTAGGETIFDILGKKLEPSELDAIDWMCPSGAVTMGIDPGDAVVWHGNSWHGGWRRELPGVRMNLAAYHCRPHLTTQELRGDTRFPEVFERHANEPRFARLLGAKVFNGWREEGPDFSGQKDAPRGLFD